MRDLCQGIGSRCANLWAPSFAAEKGTFFLQEVDKGFNTGWFSYLSQGLAANHHQLGIIGVIQQANEQFEGCF
jgi:hypothetical protein